MTSPRAVPVRSNFPCQSEVFDVAMRETRSARGLSMACTSKAAYSIDGKRYCKRHAGIVALSILERPVEP